MVWVNKKSMVLEANLGSPIKSSTCNIPVSTTAKLVKMDLDYLSSSSYEPPTYSHSFQILSPLYLPHVLSPMYTGFFFSFAPLSCFQLSISNPQTKLSSKWSHEEKNLYSPGGPISPNISENSTYSVRVHFLQRAYISSPSTPPKNGAMISLRGSLRISLEDQSLSSKCTNAKTSPFHTWISPSYFVTLWSVKLFKRGKITTRGKLAYKRVLSIWTI